MQFLNTFLILGLMASGQGYAASFDCTKASTDVEKMICGSEKLSKLDEKLALIYKKLLKYRKNRILTTEEQKTWLGTVRNNCSDEECLSDMYEARVERLEYKYNSRSKVDHKMSYLNIKKMAACSLLPDWYAFFVEGYWRSDSSYQRKPGDGYYKEIVVDGESAYVKIDDIGLGSMINKERGGINNTSIMFYEKKGGYIYGEPVLSAFDENSFSQNLKSMNVRSNAGLVRGYSSYHYGSFYFVEGTGHNYVIWLGSEHDKMAVLLFSVERNSTGFVSSFECAYAK